MSQVGVSYNIHYTPNPVGVTLNLFTNNKSIGVILQNVPRLVVTATPNYSGNVITGLVSTIGAPLANAVTLSLGLAASDILNNQRFNDIYKVAPIRFDIAGQGISIRPSGVKMSNHSGLLKITANVAVS